MLDANEQKVALLLQKCNELSNVLAAELSAVGFDNKKIELAIAETLAGVSLVQQGLNLDNEHIQTKARWRLRLWRLI